MSKQVDLSETHELATFTPEQAVVADETHQMFGDVLYSRIERRADPKLREAELAGAVAAVAETAWRGRAKGVDVPKLLAWWNELGKFYLEQFQAMDDMGPTVGGVQ